MSLSRDELLRVSSRVELLLSADAAGDIGSSETTDLADEFDSLESRIRLFAIIAIKAYIKAREAPEDGDVRANLIGRETLFQGLYELSNRKGIDLKETFLRCVRECGGDICLRGLTGIYEYLLERCNLESDEAEYESDEFYIRRFVLEMVYICFLHHQEEFENFNRAFLGGRHVRLFGSYYEHPVKKQYDFRTLFYEYVEQIGGKACLERMSRVYDLMLDAYQQNLSDSATHDGYSDQSDEDQ